MFWWQLSPLSVSERVSEMVSVSSYHVNKIHGSHVPSKVDKGLTLPVAGEDTCCGNSCLPLVFVRQTGP